MQPRGCSSLFVSARHEQIGSSTAHRARYTLEPTRVRTREHVCVQSGTDRERNHRAGRAADCAVEELVVVGDDGSGDG